MGQVLLGLEGEESAENSPQEGQPRDVCLVCNGASGPGVQEELHE